MNTGFWCESPPYRLRFLADINYRDERDLLRWYMAKLALINELTMSYYFSIQRVSCALTQAIDCQRTVVVRFVVRGACEIILNLLYYCVT